MTANLYKDADGILAIIHLYTPTNQRSLFASLAEQLARVFFVEPWQDLASILRSARHSEMRRPDGWWWLGSIDIAWPNTAWTMTTCEAEQVIREVSEGEVINESVGELLKESA